MGNMPDLFENPLGLDGFEFIEFSAPQKGVLEPVFESMEFTRIARHRSKDVDLWRQDGINLIANYEPKSPASYFAAEHGASVCGMGMARARCGEGLRHCGRARRRARRDKGRSDGTGPSGYPVSAAR